MEKPNAPFSPAARRLPRLKVRSEYRYHFNSEGTLILHQLGWPNQPEQNTPTIKTELGQSSGRVGTAVTQPSPYRTRRAEFQHRAALNVVKGYGWQQSRLYHLVSVQQLHEQFRVAPNAGLVSELFTGNDSRGLRLNPPQFFIYPFLQEYLDQRLIRHIPLVCQ
jgi:hypothetical protein